MRALVANTGAHTAFASIVSLVAKAALGALNLARRQAIVSRLTAIEERAMVDVFCSDKTGTLTENRVQVVDPMLREDVDASELLKIAVLVSRRENNDPIEQPLFRYLEAHWPELDLSGCR
jgi:H+-transporting ATPase